MTFTTDFSLPGIEPPYCLNLGSGQRPFSHPWINIDVQDKYASKSPNFLHADMRNLTMVAAFSCQYVMLHHTLEHLSQFDAAKVLAECRRVLVTGGSLIITVPNMRKLAMMWMSSEIDDNLYFTNVYGAYMGDEADRHRWAYTAKTLNANLKNLGFSEVRPFDWRPIPGADIARDDRWILGIEAIK